MSDDAGAPPVPMTEEEQARFEAELRDPALIESHERCMEILEVIDGEIASIEGQLEVARADAASGPLSAGRLSWMRRAATASSFKRSERMRVWLRSKELRGAKGPAMTPKTRDPAEGVAKQDRLRAEAEARRARATADGLAAQARSQEIAAASAWRRHFVRVAQERMPEAEFQQWVTEAKSRGRAGD